MNQTRRNFFRTVAGAFLSLVPALRAKPALAFADFGTRQRRLYHRTTVEGLRRIATYPWTDSHLGPGTATLYF